MVPAEEMVHVLRVVAPVVPTEEVVLSVADVEVGFNDEQSRLLLVTVVSH